MPNLIGRTRAQVFTLMHDDALYFITRGSGSANNKWVAVVAQSPAPGTMVAWHSQATLTTTLQSPRGPRLVPNLIGRTRAQVFALMHDAALYFRTVGPGSLDGKWTVALGQSPAAGARVAWHTEVIVTVSTHRPIVKTASLSVTRRATHKHRVTIKHTVVKHHITVTRQTTTTLRATTTTTPLPTTAYSGEVTTSTSTTSTTSTTEPVTTTTVKKKVAARSRVGVATWYLYFPGRCASGFLPMGTHLTIRDLGNGKVVHCLVTDHESARGNRVVDLSQFQFNQLAPLARGVVLVEVSW